MKHLSLLTIFLAFSYLFFPQRVYAYLDAGSGSYILQLIVGAFLGGLFILNLLWNKIRKFFRNLFSRDKHEGIKD